MAQVLHEFAPLLHGVAAVAVGNEGPRAEVEAALPQLEEGGWQLLSAVQRIWAGERDAATLTAGIDPNSAALVQRTLRLVADGPGMIFAAGALQIAHLRRQADDATAQALASGDEQQRRAPG